MRSRVLQIAFSNNRVIALILVPLIFCALPANAPAQHLSVRHYGVSEGLVNNRVTAIHQDSKGYVWFATYEGLSRFDGYRFVNYGTRDGLGHPIINAITEDRSGHLWAATNGGGVSRLLDDPYDAARLPRRESTIVGPRVVSFRITDSPASNRVNKLLFDAAGNLWCGTDDGIYRATAASVAAGAPQFERPADVGVVVTNGAALVDQQGRIWFSVRNGLIEVTGDQILRYQDGPCKGGAIAMAEDGQGNLFATVGAEVFEFVSPALAGTRGEWRKVPLLLKSDDWIGTMIADNSGTLWIGTTRGLIKYRNGHKSVYGTAQGLSEEHIRSLCQDRDGNLWIGTWEGGVCKLAGEMIVSFSKAEGLADNVFKIIEGHDGCINGSLYPGGLVQFVDGKIVPIPESRTPPFDHIGSRILQARDGQWWIATDNTPSGGVFRFRESTLQLRRGQRLLSTREVAGHWFPTIYEDPAGTIWVAAGINLYRFDPSRRTPPFAERLVLEFPPGETLEAEPAHHNARFLISGAAGTLWIGDMYMLAKYTNSKLTVLAPTDGLPETDPRTFFIDHRGWLWIGLRYKGVSMTTEPAAEHPRFVNYCTQSGLASDTVWSITEDDAGRMYFGTERGLDRLDTATGRIRHFSMADGLAGDHVNSCVKDSRGYIWVATITGVSRLDPRAERTSAQAPSVYLSRVQIAGEDVAMAETGTSVVTQGDLPASRNNLLIQYTGIDFNDDHRLLYQYELEGVDADWSAPTDQMAVNYARLAPGAYRFLVRAVNEDGAASREPAVLQFRILPPLWQRWWFISLSITVVGLAVYAVYRYRVARLIELERVRTRIASDLHDDIGANLSLLAGMSEMLNQEARAREPQMSERLSLMAAVSRRSVDAMSDIVWAVNPNRDHLRDLVQRMRRFASDAFTARNVDFRFDAPDATQDLRLSAEMRREVFLIFKEAVNNAARHSCATHAQVTLAIERGRLTLEVSDDGSGFDPALANGGDGLLSMGKRARKLGGTLTVISTPEGGTSILLKAPLR